MRKSETGAETETDSWRERQTETDTQSEKKRQQGERNFRVLYCPRCQIKIVHKYL